MRKVVVFKALGSKCQIIGCVILELEDVEEGTGDAGCPETGLDVYSVWEDLLLIPH